MINHIKYTNLMVAIFAAITGSTSALASMTNIPFASVSGTNEVIYEDSDNQSGKTPIILYFLPRSSRTHLDSFSFRIDPNTNTSDASFQVTLGKSKALEKDEKKIIQQAANKYNVSPDHVLLLPPQTISSKTRLTLPGVIEDFSSNDDVSLSGVLAFTFSMNDVGTKYFQLGVLRRQHIGTYSYKYSLIQGTETVEHQSSVPLILENLPYCKVTVSNCEL